jgi:hypothetical protein
MADEEEIVNELLKQPVEKPAVPEKPQKRPLTQRQKEHMLRIQKMGIETRKANKIKRAEEKKLEKERVLKDKIESGADEKISKLYQEKLDKMELLSQKFEEMLSAKKPEPIQEPKLKRVRKQPVKKLEVVQEHEEIPRPSCLPFKF